MRRVPITLIALFPATVTTAAQETPTEREVARDIVRQIRRLPR
jgi:hypothetical protein